MKAVYKAVDSSVIATFVAKAMLMHFVTACTYYLLLHTRIRYVKYTCVWFLTKCSLCSRVIIAGDSKAFGLQLNAIQNGMVVDSG